MTSGSCVGVAQREAAELSITAPVREIRYRLGQRSAAEIPSPPARGSEAGRDRGNRAELRDGRPEGAQRRVPDLDRFFTWTSIRARAWHGAEEEERRGIRSVASAAHSWNGRRNGIGARIRLLHWIMATLLTASGQTRFS